MNIITSRLTSIFAGLFLAIVLFFSKPLSAEANFSDVDITDPANATLGYLVHEGIIEGFPDGSFRGNQLIDRAALMKVIVLGSGADPDPNQYNNCFLDVQNQWFARHVCYAKEKGWVEGYLDGNFRPSQEVTDVEAAKIILLPLLENQINNQDPEKVSSALKRLSDVTGSEWYADYLTYMYWANLISEPNMSGSVIKDYQPNKKVNRDFVTELLARAMVIERTGEAFYHPYFLDELLKASGKNELVSVDAPCYTMDSAPLDQKSFDSLMASRYGDQDFIELDAGQMVNPFTITTCFLGNGDALLTYTGYVRVTDKSDWNKGSGTLLKIFHADGSDAELCPDSFASYESFESFVGHVDLSSLDMIDCRYFKDFNDVYYLSGETYMPFYALEGVDQASFASLGMNTFNKALGQDSTTLYYGAYPVENFDVNTMEFINERFFKDKDAVYFIESIISQLNIASFESSVLSEVNPAAFTVLTFENLESFDPLTERYHQGLWGRAGDKLYIGDVEVRMVNVDSFEVISHNYAKDKDAIYSLFDNPLGTLDATPELWTLTNQGADVDSFVVLNESLFPNNFTLAKDKDHLYLNGMVVDHGELDLSQAKLRNGNEIYDDNDYSCSYLPELDPDNLVCGFG